MRSMRSLPFTPRNANMHLLGLFSPSGKAAAEFLLLLVLTGLNTCLPLHSLIGSAPH